MNKIAIFGGTFDPLHLGHLRLAQAAVAECGLDRLLFMPNYVSPFKTDKKVTPGDMRCEMLGSITHYNPAFSVTEFEINQEKPVYTYDTLTYFRDILNAEMYFVLGFDSVVTLETWYKGPELIREFSYITARRPDTDDTEGYDKIRHYREEYNANIHILDIEPFRASSTEIRRLVSEGQDISELVPPEIGEYIYQNGLYINE